MSAPGILECRDQLAPAGDKQDTDSPDYPEIERGRDRAAMLVVNQDSVSERGGKRDRRSFPVSEFAIGRKVCGAGRRVVHNEHAGLPGGNDGPGIRKIRSKLRFLEDGTRNNDLRENPGEKLDLA